MENLETIKDLELEAFERELNEIDTEEPYINKNDIIEFIQEEVKTDNNNNIQVNENENNNNIQVNENETIETIEHIPEIETIETIEPLEEVNINTLIQPQQQQKKRGRPKKIINPEEPIIKKDYYRENNYYTKKGTKPTGRPKTTKPKEEIKQNHNKLIKEYYYRRGKHVSKLSYYAKNYNIPIELKEMKTETFEDLEKKLCRYIDYVNQFKIEINKMKLNEKINISKCNKGVLELKRELRESQREIIEM